MLLKITEYCAWENEGWSYIIDLEKQEAAAINSLMIFIRCANAEFEIAKEEASRQKPALAYHPLFNRHPRNPFAASRYSFSFYDAVFVNYDRSVSLICSGKKSHLSDGCGYHFYTNIMLDRKISIFRIKSAMIAMRDRKKNNLYKRFDTVFLAPKGKPAIAQKST